ncbi:MAG: Slp family lipoprotein [Pseudomonadota bacterium]
MRPLALVGLLVLLAGCAGAPPINDAGAEREPGPRAAVAAEELGDTLLWGGVILAIDNQSEETWLEVLAFPLDPRGRPHTRREPLGRFFAVEAGYLEPADFQPGRQVLVRGEFTEILEGKVGKADYRYPRLDVEALHLWPRGTSTGSSDSRVQFGIGIGIGL